MGSHSYRCWRGGERTVALRARTLATLLTLVIVAGACHGDTEPPDGTEVELDDKAKNSADGRFSAMEVGGGITYSSSSGNWTGTITWTSVGNNAGQTVEVAIFDESGNSLVLGTQAATLGSGNITISVANSSIENALNGSEEWYLVVTMVCPGVRTKMSDKTVHHK